MARKESEFKLKEDQIAQKEKALTRENAQLKLEKGQMDRSLEEKERECKRLKSELDTIKAYNSMPGAEIKSLKDSLVTREYHLIQRESTNTQKENALIEKEKNLNNEFKISISNKEDLERQKSAFNDEKEAFKNKKAADELALVEKWEALRKAEMEFIEKQNSNTAGSQGTSSNTGLFKLTPKPNLEDQSWWIKDDEDHPIAFYHSGEAFSPLKAISEVLGRDGAKNVAQFMALDNQIVVSNTSSALDTPLGYFMALAKLLMVKDIHPQKLLLAIHQATDINAATLPACKTFLEICFNKKKQENDRYNRSNYR